MADIENTVSVEQLELAVMEIEYRLADQENNLKKFDIEEKRLQIRLSEMKKTKSGIAKNLDELKAQLRDRKKQLVEAQA